MPNLPTYQTRTSRVWLLRTGQSSGGQVHEQRVEYLPDSPYPPLHFHPAQDEHFEVEQGEMVFIVGGIARVIRAGEMIDIPRGTAHRARNASPSQSAVVRWETRPALRTTEFFAVAAELGETGGKLRAALLVDTYRDVFRLTGVTAKTVPVLATWARLRGLSLPEV